MPKSVLPDFSAEPPAREGYLWKRSDHIKKWHKRWFVLWPGAVRPGHGRVLYWFAQPGDSKAKGMAQLVPGSFNIVTQDGQRHRKERNFPLTMVLELPDREPVKLAAANEREVHSWIASIQTRDAGGDRGKSSALTTSFASFTPNLAPKTVRGFDAHGAPAGAASEELMAADSSEIQQCYIQALQLLLPGCDVASVRGGELLRQAQHTAKLRAELISSREDFASAQRSIEVMQTRLKQAKEAAEESKRENAALLEKAEATASELRGENRLLHADVATLRQSVASTGRGGDSSDLAEEGVPGERSRLDNAAEELLSETQKRCTSLSQALEHSQAELRRETERADSLVAANRELRVKVDSLLHSGGSSEVRQTASITIVQNYSIAQPVFSIYCVARVDAPEGSPKRKCCPHSRSN